jgi:hypothetical protein
MVAYSSLRNDWLQLPSYLAAPGFADRIVWKHDGIRDICQLAKANEPVMLCLVGRVLDARFCTGPTGAFHTYHNLDLGMAPAKYLFNLLKPIDKAILSVDWVAAYDALLKIQKKGMKVHRAKNLFDDDKVAFSTPVFRKLVCHFSLQCSIYATY